MSPSAQAPRRAASCASARFVLPQILTRAIHLGSQTLRPADASGELVLAGALLGPRELAGLQLRVGGAHQGLADQHSIDADPLELLELLRRRDAALGDD